LPAHLLLLLLLLGPRPAPTSQLLLLVLLLPPPPLLLVVLLLPLLLLVFLLQAYLLVALHLVKILCQTLPCPASCVWKPPKQQQLQLLQPLPSSGEASSHPELLLLLLLFS
jgi:hypothetical protein